MKAVERAVERAVESSGVLVTSIPAIPARLSAGTILPVQGQYSGESITISLGRLFGDCEHFSQIC